VIFEARAGADHREPFRCHEPIKFDAADKSEPET
jgi:hypothetical protein